MSDKGSIFDQLRAIFGRKRQAPPPPVPETKPPSHQPPPPQRGVALVLGIDFGTSCTKVVIGDPGWRAKSYPVPLNPNAQGLSRFLKPSRLKMRTSDGNDVVEGNLKIRLMDNPEEVQIRELVIIYLASVIRQSLDWFEASLKQAYATRQPSWSLNLGFPAKAIELATPLVKSYQEVARLAAQLGFSELPINFISLGQLMSGEALSTYTAAIPPSRVQLYPEIAAQLAGYVNSPYRMHGNLLLVDVGAGTLDVSTIILHSGADQEVCSFHFCEVARFGTVPLLEARVEALNAVIPNCSTFSLEAVQDGVSAAPEDLSALLVPGERKSPRLANAFDSVSTTFAESMLQVALRCLTQFKVRQRDAHSNPCFNPWPGHLRFFLTGGGSRSAFYRKHLAEGPLENKLVRYTRWHEDPERRARNAEGLRLESLPLPNDLEGFPESLKHDFDRLSVAHGLAYGGENLMRVTASTSS